MSLGYNIQQPVGDPAEAAARAKMTAPASSEPPGSRHQTAAALRVERVHTQEDLEGIAGIWRSLLAECSERSLFFSHAWAACWWRHFGTGRRLWVLVVWDGATPVGIAPLMIERTKYNGLPARVLGFLSNNHVSRSDFVIPNRRAWVLGAIARAMREDAGQWDVLRLKHMPRESDQQLLCEALRRAGLWPFAPEESNRLYRSSIQGTTEEYLRQRSRRFRSNIRNAHNLLNKLGKPGHVIRRTPAELPDAAATFFALGDKSHKRDIAYAIYDANEQEFHKTLAAVDADEHSYEIFFLEVDGKTIAGLFSFVFERTITFMVMYFDTEYASGDPGRNMIWQRLQSILETDGFASIDWNGNSIFVQTWATDYQVFETVTACNFRPYSFMIALLKYSKRSYLSFRYRLRSSARKDPHSGQDGLSHTAPVDQG